MTDHAQCQEKAEREITKVMRLDPLTPQQIKAGRRDGIMPEETYSQAYWRLVRDAMPPYFWNRIKAPVVHRMDDAELAAAIQACSGGLDKLSALVRSGGKRGTHATLCEWCNLPIDGHGDGSV